jgi:hypothetical protein
MMYHALKMAVVCLPVVLFGLGRETKAGTLFAADNAPGDPTVVKFDAGLGFSGFFSVPDSITGISVGPSGQAFVATETHLYDYTSDGALLRQFRLIGGGGVLDDLAFDGTTLFVADNAPGDPTVVKFDASLGVSGFFSVPDSITGISVGPSGQAFVATETHLYDYTSDGALLRQFRLIGGGGVLDDLAFDGTTLFVADNAPGDPTVVKFDASLGVSGFFSVPDSITGISVGPSGQVFVATETHLYDYASDGALLRQFRLIGGGGVLGNLAFDGAGGVPASVPEPSTAFLLLIGLFAVAVAGRSATTNARRGSVHGARSFWRGAPS